MPSASPYGNAEGQVRREHGDAAVVVTEAELPRRAQHALGIDAEDAATLDGPPVGHRRAGRSERHDVANCHVERAAPHVVLDAVTGVDVDALHLGGIGMLLEAEDARRDDTRHGVADALTLSTTRPSSFSVSAMTSGSSGNDT